MVPLVNPVLATDLLPLEVVVDPSSMVLPAHPVPVMDLLPLEVAVDPSNMALLVNRHQAMDLHLLEEVKSLRENSKKASQNTPICVLLI